MFGQSFAYINNSSHKTVKWPDIHSRMILSVSLCWDLVRLLNSIILVFDTLLLPAPCAGDLNRFDIYLAEISDVLQ